jgi:integral membrane protein
MKNSHPVTPLRHIALVEGASFLVLMGIAMPLKYLAGMPMAVKVVGWIHGLLFVLFCFALLRVMMNTNWSFGRSAVVFIASLLPFGPFLIDRRMREWEKEPVVQEAAGE